MSGHETWRTLAGIDIPRTANIQARAIGSSHRPIHHKPLTVAGYFRGDHLIIARVLEQCLRQNFPIGHSKTEPQEKSRLAAARRMSGVEQITCDFFSGTLAD